MELVYLWVESYKNIEKQGFNFSPRFRCEFKAEYDEDGKLKKDCELEIIDKEKTGESYPKNFFGDNINLTAIVGENGSGKTSIFNILKEISIHMPSFKQSYDASENKIIILFKKKEINEFEYITNINEKINFECVSSKIDKLPMDILNYSAEFQKEKNYDNDIVISPNEIAKILTDNFIYKKDFKLSSFMFIPETIEIFFNSDFLNKQLENTLENEKQRIINKTINVSLDEEKEAEREMRNSIYNLEDYSADLFGVNDYHKFLIIWFIKNHYFDSDNLMDKEFLINEYIRQEPNEQINEDELLIHFSKKINDFTDREKEIYFENFHQYFSFNFIDSIEREFKDLSHGERVLFGQLINIYHYINNTKRTFILNLDEPELSLHPNWQKNYIFEIINLLKQFENKINLIVTSHSPFILSDLPKENVIFLEKGKQVYPFDDRKQTFGANIHTLLSHGFFMKDGLMGKFAKEKINQVYNFITQKGTSFIKTKEEAQNIINLIGEPMLKKELQFLYNEKFEIDDIDKQIREYEEAIEKLKSKKKKND
ncbi:AAA family ATPase [Aliarcobacter butzleri]|uniref:AAA family ATPase n=1 Tax=Aliarcobacter butzleri TaxID=28197 RepID=UPI00263D1E73|nr:AAA family ATPase [Aliarcobacter butzleri]MDN5100536.1 AAA family ATPase [Aliarcobacter butzleri]